jgi:hypothetical protein
LLSFGVYMRVMPSYTRTLGRNWRGSRLRGGGGDKTDLPVRGTDDVSSIASVSCGRRVLVAAMATTRLGKGFAQSQNVDTSNRTTSSTR